MSFLVSLAAASKNQSELIIGAESFVLLFDICCAILRMQIQAMKCYLSILVLPCVRNGRMVLKYRYLFIRF